MYPILGTASAILISTMYPILGEGSAILISNMYPILGAARAIHIRPIFRVFHREYGNSFGTDTHDYSQGNCRTMSSIIIKLE